ncbi:MAG: hypothetical protein ACXAD7_28880, partial [Candidatus Kariarchaeaceae archaeon]
ILDFYIPVLDEVRMGYGFKEMETVYKELGEPFDDQGKLITRDSIEYGKIWTFTQTEFWWMSAVELIIAVLPVGGLKDDIRDILFEASGLFRTLAWIMLPFDLAEIFGFSVFGIFKKAWRSLKRASRSIDEFFDVLWQRSVIDPNGGELVVRDTLKDGTTQFGRLGFEDSILDDNAVTYGTVNQMSKTNPIAKTELFMPFTRNIDRAFGAVGSIVGKAAKKVLSLPKMWGSLIARGVGTFLVKPTKATVRMIFKPLLETTSDMSYLKQAASRVKGARHYTADTLASRRLVEREVEIAAKQATGTMERWELGREIVEQANPDGTTTYMRDGLVWTNEQDKELQRLWKAQYGHTKGASMMNRLFYFGISAREAMQRQIASIVGYADELKVTKNGAAILSSAAESNRLISGLMRIGESFGDCPAEFLVPMSSGSVDLMSSNCRIGETVEKRLRVQINRGLEMVIKGMKGANDQGEYIFFDEGIQIMFRRGIHYSNKFDVEEFGTQTALRYYSGTARGYVDLKFNEIFRTVDELKEAHTRFLERFTPDDYTQRMDAYTLLEVDEGGSLGTFRIDPETETNTPGYAHWIHLYLNDAWLRIASNSHDYVDDIKVQQLYAGVGLSRLDNSRHWVGKQNNLLNINTDYIEGLRTPGATISGSDELGLMIYRNSDH